MNEMQREFAHWLADRSAMLKVDLDIKKSARVSARITCECAGLEDVLRHYSWNAQWTDSKRNAHRSSDWPSTRQSQGKLRAYLLSAVSSSTSSEEEALIACKAVIDWGGGARHRDNGAYGFVSQKASERKLKDYLLGCKKALVLDDGSNSSIEQIHLMNSMMSKVHAFMAEDGLPIYDSRVAAAAGCLVEIFRRETGARWNNVPGSIRFPALDPRRTVAALEAGSIEPGMLRYADKHLAREWASAMVRLGQIMKTALLANPDLFRAEGDLPNRMHAFEASLFVIGYDPKALATNLRA